MTTEITIGLLSLTFQMSSYLSAISYLAWESERRIGADAFHFVASISAGFLCAHTLAESAVVPLPLAAAVAGSVPIGIERLWSARAARTSLDELAVLIGMASLSLIVFDWATGSKPLSTGVGSQSYFLLFMLVSAAVAVWSIIRNRRPEGLRVRLGISHRWVFQYWGAVRDLPLQPPLVIYVLAWMTVIGIPLATVGVTSLSILRDVTVGILIARLVGHRGAAAIIGASATLGLMRVLAGYLLLNSAGPVLVEAATIGCAGIWLRYRGSRTPWSDNVAR